MTQGGVLYRKDIDGIRAIAVLSVVFYHMFPGKVTGGFIGVDVFFVISGYLISGIIFREIEANVFSLTGFYERRIRRILPALFVMLVTAFAAEVPFLLAVEIDNFARNGLAAAISLSNIYSYFYTNYFAALPSEQPFLHTWSLGVEEQFYIVFPLLALAIGVYSKRIKTAIYAGLAILSFALAERAVFGDPVAAFYLPQFRAWEFLAGSLVALVSSSGIKSTILESVMSGCALLLILVPTVAFTKKSPFPGVFAVSPVAGTALLLFASREANIVRRGLSIAPLIWVGRISYSLYLWHWPVIALFGNPMFQSLALNRISPGLIHPWLTKAAIFCLSLLLAYMSWRFVEQPFRHRQTKASGKKAFAFAGAGLAGLVVLFGATMASHGWRNLFDPETRKVGDYLAYDEKGNFRAGTCFLSKDQTTLRADLCLKGTGQRPSVLLVGDSHAAGLWKGLQQQLNANVLQATAPGCAPLDEIDPRQTVACTRLRKTIFENFLPHSGVKLVILAGDWGESDIGPLRANIRRIEAMGHRVLLVGTVPRYMQPLPVLIISAIRSHDPRLISLGMDPTVPPIAEHLRQLSAAEGISYYSPFEDLCARDKKMEWHCPIEDANGEPLQFDTSHLTYAGSLAMTKGLAALAQSLITDAQASSRASAQMGSSGTVSAHAPAQPAH